MGADNNSDKADNNQYRFHHSTDAASAQALEGDLSTLQKGLKV